MVSVFAPESLTPFSNPFNKMSSHQSSLTKSSSTSSSSTTSSSRSERATVLIGPKQVKFKANKKMLCAVSSFFREQLEDHSQPKTVSLWLPGESPAMFALFVEWLHSRTTFRCFLDDAINTAHETSHQATRDFHWALIHLHLFASHLSIFHLQDLAMDALQDLYLRCDWDVPPSLISYLYTKCESLPSVRLRRWAVAMVAFSMAGGSHMKFHPQDSDTSDPSHFQKLLETLPEFEMDYAMHMRKIRSSRLDIRLKNPQLRIPANKLRNDERAFGFRECSFHSHRAAVGQRRCPHAMLAPDSPVSPMGHPSELVLTGLSAPGRRDNELSPTGPMSNVDWEDELAKTVKHMRSISSTRK
ncbi:hypothetical protein HJFPF1_01006 [Paramyrothecium foliicola]|nr:hypothetical protein HJFPF1_01006 [Paramyrothecium foliicola]